MPDNALIGLRRQVNRLFDDGLPDNRVAARVDKALAVLIAINVVAVIFESVEPLRARYAATFEWIEQVATFIFAAEYLLRLWTAVDRSEGRFRDPLWGRLAYMRGFFPITDLISVLPAVVGLLGAADFRVLRLLRLLRMLKLTRRSTIFGLLWAVLREEARSLAALLFIIALTLTMGASLMYMAEGAAQPEVFSSIPAAMWWSIETLTTVGYGDMVPVTVAGKVLGGIVSISGIGILALFSGLITVSFLDQLRLRQERLQKAVEMTVGDGGALLGGGNLARLAERFGLPAEIAQEVVEHVLAQAVCPHCSRLHSDVTAPAGTE